MLRLIVGLCVLESAVAYVDPMIRIDCLPEPSVGLDGDKAKCDNRKCVWDSAEHPVNAPHCFFAENTGYTLGDNQVLSKLIGSAPNPYGTDLTLTYTTSSIGATLNMRITDVINDRFDPLQFLNFPRRETTTSDPISLTIENVGGLFAFTVKRISTSAVLFSTKIGGLLFADQYIQIAALVGSTKVYGFGENIHKTLMHNMKEYRTWGMFARDEPPDSSGTTFVPKNLYGVHPFYICIETADRAHGVFFLNSNAQEITTGPGPHIVYRTIGGLLDMYFFPGPTPEEVILQYLALIGTPFLPPYYALGYQLSRYGYTSLNELETVIAEVQDLGIPLDIPYADIDYMDRYKDFTLGEQWKEMGNHSNRLRSEGLHIFLIFDPAIEVDYDSFANALNLNASFIEWETKDKVQTDIQSLYPLVNDTKIMIGVVWPDRHVAFPDFFDPQGATTNWWIDEIVKFHQKVPFDGLWIDMNEPASFGTNEDYPFYFDRTDHPNITSLKCLTDGNQYDNPRFGTINSFYYSGKLSTKTVCMNGRTSRGAQTVYDTKNLFGLMETIATQHAMRAAMQRRGAIITRSTFPSSGHYAGHWLGDCSSTWLDLQTSIVGIQEFNFFGIPYVGSDICGFLGNTTEELCLRWHQLGAFYPFARNHNDKDAIDQHPAVWPSVANATRLAFLFRYKYLPYLYTLHYNAYLRGDTVVRPMFFEFFTDRQTHELSYQFMWGSWMLVLPVYRQGETSVKGYLPSSARWFSLRTSDYGQEVTGGSSSFSAPLNDILPVFVRGGAIIPRQPPSTTTAASRKNPFDLLIAIGNLQDGSSSQSGQLFWDDGDSVIEDLASHSYYFWNFYFSVGYGGGRLEIRTDHFASSLAIPTLDVIEIFGYPEQYEPDLSTLRINGVKAAAAVTFTFDTTSRRIVISAPNLLTITSSQLVEFSNVGATEGPSTISASTTFPVTASTASFSPQGSSGSVSSAKPSVSDAATASTTSEPQTTGAHSIRPLESMFLVVTIFWLLFAQF